MKICVIFFYGYSFKLIGCVVIFKVKLFYSWLGKRIGFVYVFLRNVVLDLKLFDMLVIFCC